MPSIDVDVTSVPDIIEAQLTLSYSRLTDLIRVIVEQGNGHEDDIDEIRDRLAKLVQENSKLRYEIESLKQNRGPGSDVAAVLEELKNTVKQLNDKADANAMQITAVTAAQTALAELVEKRAEAWQTKMQAAMTEHTANVDRRIAATEKSAQLAQAFIDLWGAVPEQVFEMGRRNANQEVEHSLKDRTTYLLSVSAFVKMREELDVLRALMQRQAADALAAKTSEMARTSRTASVVTSQHDSNKDRSAALEELSNTVRTLELQIQVMEQQRLPPLEFALRELQGRGNASERLGNTEKDVDRLYDQVALLEDRLNTLLGMSGKKNGADTTATHPALIDLAHRVSTLEGTIENLPRGGIPTNAEAVSGGAGGEAISADGGGNSSSALPSSLRGAQGRPPSGRPASAGLLPHLIKDVQNSSVAGVPATTPPPPPRSSSLLRHRQGSGQEAVQPTSDALRRQETVRSAVAADGQRISVAVEPEEGLQRRVMQLEEIAAVLEANKADRKELQQLEATLRHTLSNMIRPHSATTQNSPSLIPQRPMSTGGRFAPNHASLTLTDLAQARRGDGFSRPASATGPLGRPMFVGSSSSVFLHDGVQLTNATVSSTGDLRP